MSDAHRLGASLYVPATHHHLLEIANGHQWPGLRSVIFCTEDSIPTHALEAALVNLATCLDGMARTVKPLRFVRARDPSILERILALPGADKLDGFVFPKVERRNLEAYMNPLAGSPYWAMPTLETRDTFDPRKLLELRDHLLERGHQQRILALRIGGNDLLALLGIRRPRDMTLYRTPLGHTIAQLVTVFKPHGFQLTAPVCEHLDRPGLLKREIREDLAHGLCGKTAIHPCQVPLIEAGFQISRGDLEAARRILEETRAVFKFAGSMCELTTHRAWARGILEQAGEI